MLYWRQCSHSTWSFLSTLDSTCPLQPWWHAMNSIRPDLDARCLQILCQVGQLRDRLLQRRSEICPFSIPWLCVEAHCLSEKWNLWSSWRFWGFWIRFSFAAFSIDSGLSSLSVPVADTPPRPTKLHGRAGSWSDENQCLVSSKIPRIKTKKVCTIIFLTSSSGAFFSSETSDGLRCVFYWGEASVHLRQDWWSPALIILLDMLCN